MEMTAQATMAALQVPVNQANGSAASSKATNQTVQGTGKTPQAFTDVLGQALNGEATPQQGEETKGLEALLQTLSPAMLMALLTQNQADKLADSADTATELDPALIMALEGLDEQSDALNQLISSGEFQQWLTQVSDLLSAMNGNSIADSNEGTDESLDNLVGEFLPKTAQQAQAIVNQFMAALSQNKDSALFQQLVGSFQEIVSPVIAAQVSPKSSAGSANALVMGTNNALSNSKEASTKLQTAVQAILGAASAGDDSTVKEAGPSFADKVQVLLGNKQVSQLDVLAARSGIADRMMLAAMQSGTTVQEDMNSNANLPTAPIAIYDLTRMLQTDQVKAAQPFTAQSFVQDMSQLVLKNFKVDTLNGFSEARLSLSPENLGQVNVKLTMHNGQLVAHFAAQTLLGKEMLEGQLSQLKLALQGQGLQVEKLEVTQSSNMQSGMFQEQRQQQFTQQFARQNKSNYDSIDALPEAFSVELANLAKRNNAYNNSFNATA